MTTLLLIISAAAVIFMVFGLALFYAGQTNEKSVTNTLLMSFGALAIVLPLWAVVGHNIAFGDTTDSAFVLFQSAFAVIATALKSGSIVQRMKFSSWLIFAGIWSVAVYSILVKWTWSETGWLFNLGAIDLAGGLLIHVASGVSGLVLAFFLGKRLSGPHEESRQNVPSVILGAGILTFGGVFFNSGSVLDVNEGTALVALNTLLAASIGALAWICLDGVFKRKASPLGAAFGSVAGLVAITPAALVVNNLGAIILSVVATGAVYGAMSLKDKFIVDDTLDVAAVHGVAGAVGALSIGFLAVDTGLFYGHGWSQLGIQAISLISVIAFVFVATTVIALIIKYVLGLRVSEELETAGVDEGHNISWQEKDDKMLRTLQKI